MTGVSDHEIKLIIGNGLSWRLGQFDINQFDSTQFDTDQGFRYTFKRPVMSFKVTRGNPTSFGVKMRLAN